MGTRNFGYFLMHISIGASCLGIYILEEYTRLLGSYFDRDCGGVFVLLFSLGSYVMAPWLSLFFSFFFSILNLTILFLRIT